jgi:hypothetical protein
MTAAASRRRNRSPTSGNASTWSRRTVDDHASAILRKLDVHTCVRRAPRPYGSDSPTTDRQRRADLGSPPDPPAAPPLIRAWNWRPGTRDPATRRTRPARACMTCASTSDRAITLARLRASGGSSVRRPEWTSCRRAKLIAGEAAMHRRDAGASSGRESMERERRRCRNARAAAVRRDVPPRALLLSPRGKRDTPRAVPTRGASRRMRKRRVSTAALLSSSGPPTPNRSGRRTSSAPSGRGFRPRKQHYSGRRGGCV